jgi:starch phosphorylase
MADPYMLLQDFDAYRRMHQQVEADYRNQELWWSKAIANIAAAGIFSSDRTIDEYNNQIWHLPKHESGRLRLFKSS